MMFHKNQEHETEGFDAGKYMAQYFSVLNLIHYTTVLFTTLHYTSLHVPGHTREAGDGTWG